MESKSSYQFIHIGLLLRVLGHLPDGRLRDEVLELIDTLKAKLTIVNFEVSCSFFKSERFSGIRDDIDSLPANSQLGSAITRKVQKFAAKLESVVFAEAATRTIYTLPTRRYNTDILLNNPAKLLEKGSYDKLSEISKSDIASACRCILFGEATAAAFHILRATEETLKQYYFVHRKQKRLKKPMWVNMLDQLKAKKRDKPPKPLLDSLDMVRANYRNPTQHPEATYNIDGAQDLMGVCVDLINKITKDL